MNPNPMSDTYFVFHPHVRVVQGAVGVAVHDLFEQKLFWFNDPPYACAIADMARGCSLTDAARTNCISAEQFHPYVDALAELKLGIVSDCRVDMEQFRPVILRSQAARHLLYRDGGRVTVEIATECIYACRWCASDTLDTADACACAVWHDQGMPLPLDKLADAIEQLRYTGVGHLVVRGGEPLLQPERLCSVVDLAARLRMDCVIHSTGSGLDDAIARRLKGKHLSFVFMFAAERPSEFDERVGYEGGYEQLQAALGVCRTMGIPFSAKVPLEVHSPDGAESTAQWAARQGASSIQYVLSFVTQESGNTECWKKVGPGSPQEMAVGLTQFLHNSQSHACFDQSIFIAADGRVTPCPGWRSATANLHDVDMATVLRERMLSGFERTARNDLPACSPCEFRLGCWACLVRTRQRSGSESARHWNCSYNPETATWGRQ